MTDVVAIETTITETVEVDTSATTVEVPASPGPQGPQGAAGSDGAAGDTFPPGIVMAYAASSPPSGWLACDGSAVSRTTYAALFAIVSTTFGVGDGSSTFNLPDLAGRVPLGTGTGDAADATAHSLGEKEGTETHTLDGSEIPSHTHSSLQATANGAGGFSPVGVLTGGTTGTYGGDQAHNNLQPSLGLSFIIKT